MKIFDWYIFRNLLIATIFVSITLIVVIFLTQSLRFLELVIDSGASSISFWVLTLLALPRFFEIILPLALMAAALFVYNRMASDSELSVIRSLGHSPFKLARPALVLSLIVMVFLWGMTMWAAPKSLSQMQQMRQIIKAQFSSFFLREGVFNRVGNGLMVYARERSDNREELRGLIIHDTRDTSQPGATIMAKRGAFLATDQGYQVLVYDGARQVYDGESGTLQNLKFERYTIDLPDGGPVKQRWREPDERTVFELIRPNMDVPLDRDHLREFRVELHRRVAGPFLAVAFSLIACVTLLLGPINRHGQARRIMVAIGSVVVLQSLFLVASNLARKSDFGLALMYLVTLGPLFFMLFLLSPASEGFRRKVLYKVGSTLHGRGDRKGAGA